MNVATTAFIAQIYVNAVGAKMKRTQKMSNGIIMRQTVTTKMAF